MWCSFSKCSGMFIVFEVICIALLAAHKICGEICCVFLSLDSVFYSFEVSAEMNNPSEKQGPVIVMLERSFRLPENSFI